MDSGSATHPHLRGSPRHRVLKAAKIIFADRSALPCQLRDFSETGAQLKTEGAKSLPSHFTLLVVSDNSIRPVQVAWQIQDTLGVTFTGPARKAPARKYKPQNI